MNEPKSAKSNWALWKLCQELNFEEIKVLISKRRNDLKYEKNEQKIQELRRDISILTDAYEIMKREKEGV